MNVREAREEAGFSRAALVGRAIIAATVAPDSTVSLATVKRAEQGDPTVSKSKRAMILWIINQRRLELGVVTLGMQDIEWERKVS